MIKRELIIKAINRAIFKCQPYTGIISSLNNQVKHALNVFHDDTRTLPIERSITLNDKGEILLQNEGTNKEVPLQVKELYELLEEYPDGGFHLEHNHPGPSFAYDMDTGFATCLSEADCECLLYSGGYDDFGRPIYFFNSITADCSNGSRMTLKHGENFNINFSISKYRDAEKHLYENWSKLMDATSKYTDEKTYDEFHAKDKDGNYLLMSMSDDERRVLLDKAHNIQRQYAKKNIESFLKDNVKEFEELGFELSFGWVK